jgi:hypothetical protein
MHPVVIPIKTTGANGAAIGTETQHVAGGRLVAIDVDLANGQPATTDLTITSRGRTVFSAANLASDKVYQPRVPAQDGAGADIAGRADVPPFIHGTYEVALAQANAADPAATVRLFFE